MVRFLADEDFNNDLLRALRRRRPAADVVRVQDVGLSGRSDPEVLAWAAEQGRVLLTHDVATLVNHALARLGSGAVAERYGVRGSGFVRAGTACYISADKVARLVAAIRRA